ncbi:MAG TPA: DinB family protein [Pyrinomonadaceae bacterium]|nr:DinB family protein [Pyrinomonadaceae bacterium]
MQNVNTARPDKSEYAPYYEKYMSLVPAGDIIATLGQQLEGTLATLRGITEEQANSRYAEGKWSVKELVGHIIDTERIFGYRALRFARNDQTPLPGYEQDDYVSNARFGELSLSDLAEELEHVRKANLCLFRQFDAETWQRQGEANNQMASVRALVHIIAGHETHHMNILRTRYLSSTSAA